MGPDCITLLAHDDSVYDTAWLPDGRSVVSGARDRVVHVWDVAARRPRRTWTLPGITSSVSVAADSGRYLSVRLACNFFPDRGCRFTRVDYTVRLTTDMTGDPPCAVDLFPQNLGEERRYTRSYKLSADLAFGFAEATAEAGHEEEVIRYQPTIVAGGLLSDEPNWTFRTARTQQLEGIREMFMVVKAPLAQTVQASFVIAAEVRTAMGVVPLRRYREPRLLTEKYPLA